MSKSVRAALLDRRFSVDKEEKAILQRCLDTLQERIPVRYGCGKRDKVNGIY